MCHFCSFFFFFLWCNHKGWHIFTARFLRNTMERGKNQSWCLNPVKVLSAQNDDYITEDNSWIREIQGGRAGQIPWDRFWFWVTPRNLQDKRQELMLQKFHLNMRLRRTLWVSQRDSVEVPFLCLWFSREIGAVPFLGVFLQCLEQRGDLWVYPLPQKRMWERLLSTLEPKSCWDPSLWAWLDPGWTSTARLRQKIIIELIWLHSSRTAPSHTPLAVVSTGFGLLLSNLGLPEPSWLCKTTQAGREALSPNQSFPVSPHNGQRSSFPLMVSIRQDNDPKMQTNPKRQVLLSSNPNFLKIPESGGHGGAAGCCIHINAAFNAPPRILGAKWELGSPQAEGLLTPVPACWHSVFLPSPPVSPCCQKSSGHLLVPPLAWFPP